MKLIRARIALTQCGSPIENAAVIVKAGRVIAAGSFQDLASLPVEERIDLGEQILLPGLINAHCHLDYTGMRGTILPTKLFTQWLQKIIALKRTQTNEDYLAAIEEGGKELRRWGVTSVFNIASLPVTRLPTGGLRTWWFYELMDIRSPVHTEKVALEAFAFFEKYPSHLGGVGLSPHAPYTTSRELYRHVKLCSEKYSMPVTTHLAETAEELEMFRDGAGPLFEFLKGLGRNMRDCGKKSPVAIFLEENLLPQGAILAHMNALDEADWDTVCRNSSDFSIVHCPKTHVYFGREKFHFDRLRQCGVSVSLGTDSLASNDSLNLFEEMRLFLHLHSGLTEREVLDMVTVHPARAIGQPSCLGVIRPGAFADLIAIPYAGGRADAYAAVVGHSQPIEWMMIDGVQH